MTVSTAIALNRFGLGARPDQALPSDPRAWLSDQFGLYDPNPSLLRNLKLASEIGVASAGNRRVSQKLRRSDRQKPRRKSLRDAYRIGVEARAMAALTTAAPFVERLVHFWSNHFAVSANGVVLGVFAPLFERDAIRPHVLGKFENMLASVERHPAMLIFLDQAKSVGPKSAFAKRLNDRRPQRRPGLNENFAREIMELHTLGARSGYTQRDVIELSSALTGWSVGGFGPRRGAQRFGDFEFRPNIHEPGLRTVLGRKYAQPGEDQGRAILNDLAHEPATARHVATKLARHFVADDPPPELIERLTVVFLASRGDLPSVYAALVRSEEAWNPAFVKFKTPWEWTISALRGTGRTSLDGLEITYVLQQLGQPVWRPGSPAGWDDVAAAWAAPDALIRRVELAQRLASQSTLVMDPRSLARTLLPGMLSDFTATQIARAESVQTALTLLLVSSEFQRR